MKLDKKQKQILIIIIIACLSVFALINYIREKRQIYVVSPAGSDAETDYMAEQNETAEQKIIVHVEGEVHFPGIYELDQNSRIFDAVEAAGGLTTEADTKRVNLAKKINDEEFIYIPGIGEDYALSGMQGHISTQNNLVNINTSSKEQLMTLPGIGEALAGRIIQYRDVNGPFNHTEDIKKVSGIGDKKFDDIKDKITAR